MERSTAKLLIYIGLLLSFPSYAHGQGVKFVSGEIIVKLKSQNSSGFAAAGMSAKASQFAAKVQSERGMKLKNSFTKMGVLHLGLRSGQKVEDAVAELKADPEVEYAEPNYIFSKANVGTFSQIATLSEVTAMAGGGGYLATDAAIHVVETWGSVTYNGEPIVAVIDTGVDTTHSVFADSGAIWTNSGEVPGNGRDDDRNGYIDDVHGYNFVSNSGAMLDDDGHGTHVSGIILGVSQNIYGASVAPAKLKIMPLKFLDGSGYGKTSDAIEAIYYAINNGATVLNNSWGGPSYSAALHEAITYSYNAGAVFVAAAGNAASNNDATPMYPANYTVPNVISVAATTDADSLASFSNFGHSSVHLASPGVGIWSTYPDESFAISNGTSMAAPFVSGVAALMKMEKPAMLGYQIRDIIMTHNDYKSSLQNKLISESRLNAQSAVAATKTATVLTTQPEYVMTNADRELASAIAGGGCGLVKKLYDGSGKGGSSGGGGLESWSVLAIVALFMIPFLIYSQLRVRTGKQRRKHDRYKIDTEVRVKVGDRELVGAVSSISLGGVQINTDSLIEQGGIVQMTIRSPDGKEQIQVEGQVVWSEEKKAYGVKFAEASATPVRAQITNWTKALTKA